MKDKVSFIISCGLTLFHLEPLDKFGELINLIKHDFESGMTEATVATHFKRNSLNIELYPKLNEKKPDVRLRWQNSWIYIEITRLRPKDRTGEKIEKLCEELARQNESRHLDISCLKDPNPKEAFKILSACKKLLFKGKQDSSYRELELPRLCVLTFDPKNESVLHLDLGTFVINQKLSNFLKREKKQLSEEKMGIVMVDVGDYKKRIERLVNYINNRLVKLKEKKLGAIVIFETEITDYRQKSQLKQLQIIKNSSASCQIPKDFWDFLISSVNN